MLLSASEPSPYYTIHPLSDMPVLLVCDHASCRFPESLGDMGLDPFARRCHLAVDIGAGALTEYLADSLGVTAVVAQYSRLVMDCNRQLLDPSAFLEFGDGVVVPGNRNLSAAAKEARANEIYWPYHRGVEAQVKRLLALGKPPVFVSVHSFTPVMNGESRPWQIGVLWDKDRPTAKTFIDGFRDAGYVVGDNEPYSGKAPQDFTIDYHAEEAGLPHVGIEIRQDLIDNPAGIELIASQMHKIIQSIADGMAMATDQKTA
ncbi:MAG: N-formylglutamate amidohydrolase [Pseudomonadota bacterium]